MDADKETIPESIRTLLPQTLHRLTAGLPKHELDLICKEARACEFALKKEIEVLEAELGIAKDTKKDDVKSNDDDAAQGGNFGLEEPTMISIPQLPLPYQPGGGGSPSKGGVGHINFLSNVDEMLTTEFTPPDRYFTVSAVLGRLKDPMKLPLPPNSVAAIASLGGEETEHVRKRRKMMLEKQQALLDLDKNEIYHRDHSDNTVLLNLWKRISSHRTAMVFRKPVNPAEAPGYTERIGFPIDLSLIRKFIVSRLIKSFASLHQRIGLICHNCVKFNGRESDYAILTREFEDLVDDKIVEAVRAATEAAPAPPAATAAATAAEEPKTANV
eukprot:CCRYP_013385-RB/>CCRYP_013385-RB protein AED:0.32 eAED:0.32 QI:137/1/1/1/0.66/0.57/7/716/328